MTNPTNVNYGEFYYNTEDFSSSTQSGGEKVAALLGEGRIETLPV